MDLHLSIILSPLNQGPQNRVFTVWQTSEEYELNPWIVEPGETKVCKALTSPKERSRAY